jgi:cathepsin X
MRQRAWPDFMMAVQEIVNCVPDGCAGGDPDEVHAHIHKHGIAPDTCQNYVAAGTGAECRPDRKCENCMGNSCYPIADYPKFGVSEYGNALGVQQMKAELQRGPIACGICSDPIVDWGFGPNRTAIFDGGIDQWAIDHEISVVGYGVGSADEGSAPYWIIRNSWGEYWGDNGFFRLRMGQNQLGIEGNACSWAVPSLPAQL